MGETATDKRRARRKGLERLLLWFDTHAVDPGIMTDLEHVDWGRVVPFIDTERDVHSPRHRGFWWAHVGWITAPGNFPTDMREVKDLARYPELRFLDRFDTLVPLTLAVALLTIGGWQFLFWGFFVSTVVLFHCTCFINSLAHVYGRQRYATGDDSRNSLLLALITFGEGWHNNHHKFPGATRQGFYWWEIDLTYYVLWVLARLKIIWDLRPVPRRLLEMGA